LTVDLFGQQYHANHNINPTNKDSVILCCEKAIIELGELRSFTSDINALKNHLTTSYFDLRNPYGKYSVSRPHLASYIGTGNPTGLGIFKDPTGSRRFITTELTRIDWRGYTGDYKSTDLWSEALELYKTYGDKLNLYQLIDKDKQEEINARYNERGYEYDLLDTMIRFTGDKQDKVGITHIVDRLKEKSKEKESKLKKIVHEYLKEKYNVESGDIRIGSKAGIKGFEGILLT